ncbi:hypothetical protein BKH43_01610 [Helicobacter sp. 13S00401-1]|uniref:glycosyltransferase family 9 protein n=1 Tax=Helicobacter sp. 13S00401-1 TaxID=1905758 RepID=UPI000BA69EF0|nr:glycosyltransferase family 9 protein [Helicobacter sp. 13S00401-1]PAF51363.1 hypothetical protein BKH43_01610 [Helicobacter sp. 13S00401-1]
MIKLFIDSPLKELFFKENKFFINSSLEDCDIVISDAQKSIQKATLLHLPVLKPQLMDGRLDVNMSFAIRQPSFKEGFDDFLRGISTLPLNLKRHDIDQNFWQKEKKTIVLFCLDGLSGYILFRNALPHLLEKYDLVLVSSDESKEFIRLYDEKNFKEIIYIDYQKLESSLSYLKASLKELSSLKAHFLFNTSFSNKPLYKLLSIYTNATSKVMVKGNLTYMNLVQYMEYANIYARTLDTSPCICFEHYRYIDMTKAFMNKSFEVNYSLERIKEDSIKDKTILTFKDKNYILVSLETSLVEKRYKHFDRVLTELLEHSPNLNIVLCGQKQDLKLCSITHANITNLVGKLDLESLIFLLQNSALNVVNDSYISHLSNALNKPTLTLASADNLGRFSKYPRELRPNSHTIYEDAIEENFNGVKLFSNLGLIYPYVAKKFSVSSINPTKVVSSILKLLK